MTCAVKPPTTHSGLGTNKLFPVSQTKNIIKRNEMSHIDNFKENVTSEIKEIFKNDVASCFKQLYNQAQKYTRRNFLQHILNSNVLYIHISEVLSNPGN